jgi:hypothetical protein
MRKSLTLGLIEAKDAYREILTGAIEGLPAGVSLGGSKGDVGGLHWVSFRVESSELQLRPLAGVPKTAGRAGRRWLGHCTECGAFISKRFSDVKGKSAIFCNHDCRGKWTSRNLKGKPRNLPFR